MQIYDVTKNLEDHPGGADVLLEATGTAAFCFPILVHWVLVSCMVCFDSVSIFLKVRMLRKNLMMRGTARVPLS